MATANAPARDNSYGRLTDEGIDRLRQRIGIQYIKPTVPHNFEVSRDATRHFAFGYGDDNPLWHDPAYADETRWRGVIAPPNFLYTMGEQDAAPPTAEIKALLKGDPLAGLGSYQASMEFEWWRPLRLGDRLTQRSALIGVRVNDKSSFSGRTVSEIQGYIYANQERELVAIRRGTWARAERHATAKKKKTYELPEPYTDEYLRLIDKASDAERRRGGETRYFEDIVVGEEMQTIVRGPLRTSDLIVWHIGWGMQLTPPGAFRLSQQVRKKVPGMFTRNALNVPDTVQRLHWEKDWANELGIPIPYDYGGMRETFLTNLVTNWMGDDGWLWKLTCQHRKFVYTGDTYWMKGSVIDKREVNGRAEVTLEIRVENQHGSIVTPGTAVVLLPTRSRSVELPTPAEDDMERMYAHEIARCAEPA